MSAKLAPLLATMVLLAACATPPQVVRSGDPAFAQGKTVALAPTAATPLDHARPDQASALVLEKLGSRMGDPATADYLMQVAFSQSPKGVGVMRDGAGDWVSDPRGHGRFGMRGGAYLLNVTAIETRTGKAAFSATATERAHGDPAKAVDRLVRAALMP